MSDYSNLGRINATLCMGNVYNRFENFSLSLRPQMFASLLQLHLQTAMGVISSNVNSALHIGAFNYNPTDGNYAPLAGGSDAHANS